MAGYAKVGSLVALMHDVSEIPVDLYVLCALRGWRYPQVLTSVSWWVGR